MTTESTTAPGPAGEPLHQINVTYVPAEDRLMLRVSTRGGNEYRVWMTRRFTGLLHNVLVKEMEKHGGVPTIASSQETRTMFKKGAMEKHFEEDKAQGFPLGQRGVLAFKIAAATTADGTFVVQLLPQSGQGVTLNLNKTLLFMFHNLLAQGIAQAAWRIDDGGTSGKLH